jgi:hypothetical protein
LVSNFQLFSAVSAIFSFRLIWANLCSLVN